MPFPPPDNYKGGSFPGDPMFFVDGDHSVPEPIGPPKITFPFEGDSHAPTLKTARLIDGATNPTGFKYQLFDPDPSQSNSNHDSFIFEQRFRIAAQWFAALPLDTVWDKAAFPYQGNLDVTRLILVSESPTTEVDGGFLEWTRTYATVPFPRNTYESFTYTFPGIDPDKFTDNSADAYADIASLSRLYSAGGPFTADVLVRVERIFFLVPGGVNPQAFSPSYDDYSGRGPFFIEPEFRVFFGVFANKVDYCWDGDMDQLLSWFDSKSGDPSAEPPALNTIPPKSVNDSNNSDSGVAYNDMLGTAEVCVKASQIRPWRGNIYEKVTLWAVAV